MTHGFEYGKPTRCADAQPAAQARTGDDARFLDWCKSRVEHGVPGLTIDEQKRVLEIAMGIKFHRRKRCLKCEGTGLHQASQFFRGGLDCTQCDGQGYVYDSSSDSG